MCWVANSPGRDSKAVSRRLVWYRHGLVASWRAKATAVCCPGSNSTGAPAPAGARIPCCLQDVSDFVGGDAGWSTLPSWGATWGAGYQRYAARASTELEGARRAESMAPVHKSLPPNKCCT